MRRSRCPSATKVAPHSRSYPPRPPEPATPAPHRRQRPAATGYPVALKVANPRRDIARYPCHEHEQRRLGRKISLPFPGSWKAILTVDGFGPSAVVTTADITIRD